MTVHRFSWKQTVCLALVLTYLSPARAGLTLTDSSGQAVPVRTPSPIESEGECPLYVSQLERDMQAAAGVVLETLNPLKCDLSLRYGFKMADSTLGPFWAQEQIGADLAKETMKELESRGVSLHETKVANIDSGFAGGTSFGKNTDRIPQNPPASVGTHAIKVNNIINGNGPFGVASHAAIVSNADFATPGSSFNFAVLKTMDSQPDLINLEVHTLTILRKDVSWDETKLNQASLQEALPKLTKTGIVVAAAGNLKSTDRGPLPELKDVIVVGSTNPQGFVSDFSQSGAEVTILAPSNHQMTAPANGPHDSKFGGTSGATPQVTGAIANVLSILPGLTPQEIKVLLQKTATPLPVTNASPNQNGVGLLNAYKLVEVAKRLRAMGWPRSRGILLSTHSIYDFNALALSQRKQALDLIKKSKGCNDLVKAKKLLRSSFLLDPASETAETLTNVLASGEAGEEAEFYSLRTREAALSYIDRATLRATSPNFVPTPELSIRKIGALVLYPMSQGGQSWTDLLERNRALLKK